jgi:hypothetical protein
MIFFSKNSRASKLKISKIQNLSTMEPELQMAALEKLYVSLSLVAWMLRME